MQRSRSHSILAAENIAKDGDAPTTNGQITGIMKRLLFTLLALFVLCAGLQAQNTNTTNQKGVTATGQLDTVRNTRLQPVLSDGPALQTGFVSPTGEKGNRPRLARTGQRLKAIIKVTSSSIVNNSVTATTVSIAASVSDSGDYALPIIERGVCYATTANPTLLTATKVIDANISGKGFGNFNVSLSGLLPNTAYHARAYAVSLYDTVYGEDLTFTTLFAAGTISYATTSVEKMTIEPKFTNELTKVGNGTVTYSKTGNICSVNATTGEVTLNGNTGTCTITATVTNSSSYVYAQNTASYTLTVLTPEQTPLTFEAKTAGATVTFNKGTGVNVNNIEYSVNGGNWVTYTYGNAIPLTNVGDRVSFRGINASYSSSYTGSNNYCFFSISNNNCYVYGNVMSLINKNNFATNTTLAGAYTFRSLFSGNNKIYNHPTKPLKLPATTLTENCYRYMFNGCSNLTSAPALPATTLTNSCYYGMFYGCSNLTSAPALPATTLAEGCYRYMFNSCSNLTSPPPVLPATTLTAYCYECMFYNCTSLTSAPALSATTLAIYCCNLMFYNCSNLTTAPVLLATKLVQNCYSSMFYGCKKLNSVTCLATNISEPTSTLGWLYYVASTGTFTKAAGVNWSVGDDGIPYGWTVVNQ